jgi:hypothetical protein
MAKNEFVLEVNTDRNQSKAAISKILGIKPNRESEDWCLSFIIDYDNDDITDTDEYADSDDAPSFVDKFIDLLDGKFELLAEIDVMRSDIVFWQYYEYNGQCNLELTPKQLKKLGDNEIRLCIICWDVNNPNEVTQ